MHERQLERVRSALGGEPSLVLLTQTAALACDPLELVFVDNHGLQRLKLRDLRKVTHQHGELVVSGEGISVRGTLGVDSAQVKAFFADVQALRKRREAGLPALVTSAFSPASWRETTKPLPETLEPPLAQSSVPKMEAASLERPRPDEPTPAPINPVHIAPSDEIPGFQLGLSATSTPARPPEPPLRPSRAEPVPPPPPTARASTLTPMREAPSLEPSASVVSDLLSEPRVPKPNPRVAKPVEKESLPPPKANPRVVAVARTGDNEAMHERSLAPQDGTPHVPTVARVTSRSLQKPVMDWQALGKQAKVVVSGINFGALEGWRNWLNWDGFRQRAMAGSFDGAVFFVLSWLVTRFVGGRDLESLLRMPSLPSDSASIEITRDLLPVAVALGMSSLLACIALGIAYFVVLPLGPWRATLGERLVGLQVVSLKNALPKPLELAARFGVNLMLFITPPMFGLFLTLLSLNEPTNVLQARLTIFESATWVGVISLIVGQVPIWGRGQSIGEYLSDTTLRRADLEAASRR
jgi:uncharacterized RDD family membrane protein YckC